MPKIKLSRAVVLALILALVMALVACGDPVPVEEEETPDPVAEPLELVVFAAASMTETLTQISKMYKDIAPNVTLIFNFDSSGTLKTQIEEGAPCDIFISAAQKQMNQLDRAQSGEANADGLDFVEQGSRINFLQNTVSLTVPEGNPKDVTSFEDMAEKLEAGKILLAMGNEDVPVGQYTQKILTYFELDEKALASAGSITYGSNVKEVTTQVDHASVDCGIIYGTDAYSAGLTTVDIASKEMAGQIIYPAAMLNISENKEAAKAFLDYLQTDACTDVFAAVGFAPVE